jgi:hypothetical protein
MASLVRAFTQWLLLSVVLCLAATANAQDRVAQYAQQLRTNSDFRVRTQAALALGASKEKRAVEPLCGGLDDSNTTVRAAAAAALGKLSLGGQECLEEHLEEETNASVKSVIQKAIERVRSGGVVGTPPEAAKYYVAIGAVTNKTTRSDADLNRVVRAHALKQLAQLAGYAVAPEAETPVQARDVLAKHAQLRPFFIWPKIEIIYVDGNLTVKVDMSLFTYPGKAFKGALNRKLTMPEVPSPDTAEEDSLIEAAMERLIPDIAKVADKL